MQNSEENAPEKPFELIGVRPEALENDYPMPMTVPAAPRVGYWGYLGYYIPAGLMPASDLSLYMQRWRGEEIYCCVREEPPFVVVRNNVRDEYRVNPERFLWIPTPRFQRGDCVQTNVGTLRVGEVAARSWHRKNRQLYYLISIEKNGRRKLHKRRYSDHELEFHITN